MPHEYVLLTPRVIGLREVAHAVAATEPTLTYRVDAGGMQIVLLDGDATVLTVVHPVPARPAEVRRLLGEDDPVDAERWWIDVIAPWEGEQRAARVIAALAAGVGWDRPRPGARRTRLRPVPANGEPLGAHQAPGKWAAQSRRSRTRRKG